MYVCMYYACILQAHKMCVFMPVCMRVYLYAHRIHAGVHGSQKRASHPLELDLEMVVS